MSGLVVLLLGRFPGGDSPSRLPMSTLRTRRRGGELLRGALEGLCRQVLELLDLPLDTEMNIDRVGAQFFRKRE